MQVGNFHIDFVGLGQILLGLAAVLSALRSRNIAKGKIENAKVEDGK